MYVNRKLCNGQHGSGWCKNFNLDHVVDTFIKKYTTVKAIVGEITTQHQTMSVTLDRLKNELLLKQ